MQSPRDFLDINVFLALAVEKHSHRKRAFEYLTENQHRQVVFSNSTMMGYLRASSNLKIEGELLLSPEQSIASWIELSGLLQAVHVPEPIFQAIEFIDRYGDKLTRKSWSDLYLLLIAQSLGARFVTLDQDFLAIDSADVVVLQ